MLHLCCLEECCTDSVVLGTLHNVVLGMLPDGVVLGTLHNVGILHSVVLETLYSVVLRMLHSQCCLRNVAQ